MHGSYQVPSRVAHCKLCTAHSIKFKSDGHNMSFCCTTEVPYTRRLQCNGGLWDLQGCTDCGGPEAETDLNYASGSRLFRFWVTDRRGDKLDYARCTALIYTMGLLLGKRNAPLRPPGSSFATIAETGGSALL